MPQFMEYDLHEGPTIASWRVIRSEDCPRGEAFHPVDQLVADHDPALQLIPGVVVPHCAVLMESGRGSRSGAMVAAIPPAPGGPSADRQPPIIRVARLIGDHDIAAFEVGLLGQTGVA